MVIIQFIKENIICDIFLVFALLSWGVTIGAMISSKRTGHYVSGIPAVGGILVIIGFLTSSVKWLAFLGLLDPALFYVIFVGIPGLIKAEYKIKKWEPAEEFDGCPVVDYTRYNKSYEEIHTPLENSQGYLVNHVNRYIIIQKDGGYELLKVELTDRIVERFAADSVEECKKKASPKAVWCKENKEAKNAN
jgi:hypothetical protein